MSTPRLPVACAVIVTVLACESGIGAGRPDLGFPASAIELCREGTHAVDLRTKGGGRLTLEVLDACGATLVRCQAPDLYAPDAVTSIRLSGSDVLVEGCAASAEGGAGLRATFAASDAATEAEVYEVALRGGCLGTTACRDAGPPSDSGT